MKDVAGCLVIAVLILTYAGWYVRLATTNPLLAMAMFVLALAGIPLWLVVIRRYKAGHYD